MSSTVTWTLFIDKILAGLNVHPERASSVQLEYRFSTDNKDSLPCDLTLDAHFKTMITLLRPLIVPPLTKSGKPSAKSMKAVAVQIFNRHDIPPMGEKVCFEITNDGIDLTRAIGTGQRHH